MFWLATDLIIGNSLSNAVHEFRHNLNILVVFLGIDGLDSTQDLLELVLDPIKGARKSQYRIDSGGAGATNVDRSSRRFDSCASGASLSSFHKLSLSNRANAVLIFPFVTGDFCLPVRQTFR